MEIIVGKKKDNDDVNILDYLIEIKKILKNSASLAKEVKEITHIVSESDSKYLKSIDVKRIDSEE
jgi:hypothetical protein